MTSVDNKPGQIKMHDDIDVRRTHDVRGGLRIPSNSEVVLICPDEDYRRMLTKALAAQNARIVNELSLYPAYNHLLSVIDIECDAYLIEINTDTAAAMNLVEAICDRKPSD